MKLSKAEKTVIFATLFCVVVMCGVGYFRFALYNRFIINTHIFFLPKKIWAWTNQTHISHQDIDKLWELINTCTTYKMTDLGNSRIIDQFFICQIFYTNILIFLHQSLQLCFRIRNHRTIFINTNFLSIFSDPILRKENRSMITIFQGNHFNDDRQRY